MPIVSHADKENAAGGVSGEGAPEKKKYGGTYSPDSGRRRRIGITADDFNKLTTEQQAEFLFVLLDKKGGKAQAIALGKELKEICKDSEDAVAASKETVKANEAKMLPLLKVHQQFRYSMLEATTMMPLLKEDQRARKTLDSAYSTLEATTGSLAVVECAITRNSKAVADRLLDEMLAE